MEKDPEEELASLRAERDAAFSRIRQLEEAVQLQMNLKIAAEAELRRRAGKEGGR